MRQRSVSQTFSLPLDLVERIETVSERLRINRSVIARQAIEREFRRYEPEQGMGKVGGGSGVRRRGGVRKRPAARP